MRKPTPDEQETILDLAHQEYGTWRLDHNPTPEEMSKEFHRCFRIAWYKVMGQDAKS